MDRGGLKLQNLTTSAENSRGRGVAVRGREKEMCLEGDQPGLHLVCCPILGESERGGIKIYMHARIHAHAHTHTNVPASIHHTFISSCMVYCREVGIVVAKEKKSE